MRSKKSIPATCKCETRKVSKNGCCDAVALGLTAGEFNALGGFPESAPGKIYGAVATVSQKFFMVARVTVKSLVKKGCVTRRGHDILLTEKGRELRRAVRATNHWSRADARDAART